MAVGDGGFKQVPLGFDKNEVNTYIADLRKKQKAMEEEVKANAKKTEEAVKLAEEADARIKAAEKAGEEKAAEITKQLEEANAQKEELEAKLAKFKDELEKERKNMSEMLMSGKGVNAEANKAYTEVINKANADAEQIIADAEEKAKAIVADAEARRAETEAKTSEFLAVLKAQVEAFGAGYTEIAGSASTLLGSAVAAAPVVSMPEPVKAAAAVSAAPAETVSAPADEMAQAVAALEEAIKTELPEATVEVEVIEEPAAEDSVLDFSAFEAVANAAVAKVEDTAADMPAISEAVKDDTPASFDDVWGGNELAQTIYNDEKKDAVPLVNPDARDMFGKDLFGLGESNDDELSGDIVVEANEPEKEEPGEDIQPLDVSDIKNPAFDAGFDNDLLSQTMPSGSLGDVSAEMLEALKAAEESFAVKPAQPDVGDLDMDAMDDTSDDPRAAELREIEAMLNGAASSVVGDTAANESPASEDDPWAALQSQLEAMQAGGLGADIPDDPTPAPDLAANDPAAPSADDASIWDFGSGSSDSDDDMSGDFSGFGGF